MVKYVDYTARAQRFSARFPAFSYILIQITFWVFANVLLGVVLYLQALNLRETYHLAGLVHFTTAIVSSVIMGILYGTSFGSIDYYLDQNLFRRQPLGKIILFKTLMAVIILTLLFYFIRFVLLDPINALFGIRQGVPLAPRSWDILLLILLIYYFFMSLVINFINQVNKKYGPGILVPLLLGKYRSPRVEERIFMFMDLKSSTLIAEKLGHVKYSAFIRDCFLDINHLLRPYNAQVYQYVGDEIVLTWTVSDGLKDCCCIRFYFACEDYFQERKEYYMNLYGFVPFFKAGLHIGQVTVVEVGEIKRDIAYHGDTLNTASRIQAVCNEFNKRFLVSNTVLERLALGKEIDTESLGSIQLRGKVAKIDITSLDVIKTKLVLEHGTTPI